MNVAFALLHDYTLRLRAHGMDVIGFVGGEVRGIFVQLPGSDQLFSK